MFEYDKRYKSGKIGYYYSCPWIEHGIVFFQNKIAFCCQCSNSGGGHTLVQDNFKGEKIDWQRFNEIKSMFRYFHRQGKINKSCYGCSELKCRKWDGGNYIENLYISHWTYCNTKCIYCYERKNPDEFSGGKNYRVLPLIKKMHSSGILRAGGMIYFGGGEPVLLDEFEQIMTYLLDNYFWGIKVHSSGIKYSPAMARAIEEMRGSVIISADSGCPETYKKIKQTDNFDKVYENLRLYALKMTYRGRFNTGSKYIIIPNINDNKEEIDKWLQADYDAGLWSVMLDIEENWYFNHRFNIPEYIYDLIKYTKKRSKQLHFNLGMYERMQNMLNDEYKKTGRRII